MVQFFIFPIPLWCYLLCSLALSGLVLWGGIWRQDKDARETAERECADVSTLKEQIDELRQRVADMQQILEAHQALLDMLIRQRPDPAWIAGVEGLEDL